jgi:hypothetical protein
MLSVEQVLGEGLDKQRSGLHGRLGDFLKESIVGFDEPIPWVIRCTELVDSMSVLNALITWHDCGSPKTEEKATSDANYPIAE